MGHRVRSSLKVLIFLVILLALGLLLFRIPLASQVLTHQLSRLGIPDHSFEITELNFHQLRLSDVALGSSHELQSDTINAQWNMNSVLSGGIQSLEIEGLRAHFDLRQGAPLLGSLQPLLDANNGPSHEAPDRTEGAQLPKLVLRDARFSAKTDDGGVTLEVAGEIVPQGEAEAKLDLVVHPRIRQGQFGGIGEAKLVGTLPLILKNAQKPAEFDVAMDGALFPVGVETALDDLSMPTSNKVLLQTHVAGTLALPKQASEPLLDWLEGLDLRGTGRVVAVAFDMPEKVSDLDGESDFEFSWQHRMARFTLTEKTWLEASEVDTQWLRQMGVPDQFENLTMPTTEIRLDVLGDSTVKLTQGMEAGWTVEMVMAADFAVGEMDTALRTALDLGLSEAFSLANFSARELAVTTDNLMFAGNNYQHLQASGEIEGTPQQFLGSFDVEGQAKSLSFDAYTARQLALQLPVSVERKSTQWVISLPRQGKLSAARLRVPGKPRLLGSVGMSLSKGRVDIESADEGLIVQHDIWLRPDDLRIRIPGDKGQQTAIDVQPGSVRLTGYLGASQPYTLKTALKGGRVSLPQFNIQLGGLDGSLPFRVTDGAVTDARFSVAQITHLSDQPYFEPMTMSGWAKLKQDRLTVRAKGGVAGLDNLDLTLNHNLSNGRGHLAVNSEALNFTPGGLQPAALSGDLSVMEDVSGELESSARLHWSGDAMDSQGRVALNGWSFDLGSARISGLWAGLAMTNLISPESEPEQSIEIARIDLGLPLEEFRASYAIRSGDHSEVVLNKASVQLLGGQLSVDPAVIDPLAESTDFKLRVRDLDLGQLFEWAGVEGLAGSGRLQGTIPVRFSGTQVAITDGQLKATEPGILRLRSEAVSQVLGGRVLDVDQLIEALTEFHYRKLALTLNNSQNNDMVAKLSMLGSNPNVLEGREFQLNLNLESNISKLLGAVAEGYGLSNKALQRALTGWRKTFRATARQGIN